MENNALAYGRPMGGVPGGDPLGNGNALGAGLAQGAADLISLRKVWQEAYGGGETNLQFTDWLAAQGITNPVIRR